MLEECSVDTKQSWNREYWKVAKKIMRNLWRTKNYLLTYKHVDCLEIVGYLDLDCTSFQDSKKIT